MTTIITTDDTMKHIRTDRKNTHIESYNQQEGEEGLLRRLQAFQSGGRGAPPPGKTDRRIATDPKTKHHPNSPRTVGRLVGPL
jgi:hypothetical protein